jgi:hypothetical protein
VPTDLVPDELEQLARESLPSSLNPLCLAIDEEDLAEGVAEAGERASACCCCVVRIVR